MATNYVQIIGLIELVGSLNTNIPPDISPPLP